MPRKRPLPPPPTGYEVIDLLWAEASIHAPRLLELLPTKVAPEWGQVEGAKTLFLLQAQVDALRREFQRTPIHSTLTRPRLRELRSAEETYELSCLAVAAALVQRIQRAYPKATAPQVFMQVGVELRPLLQAAMDAMRRP